MGVNGKRSYSLLLLAMLILVVATKSSGSAYEMESRIIADDMELELIMDSEISRMLGPSIKLTTGAGQGGNVPTTCGRGKPYKGCIPPGGIPKKGEHCGKDTFSNRLCPPP